MRKIYFVLLALLSVFVASAQEPRTLVIKTTDGNSTRFDLDKVAEIYFDDEAAALSTVKSVLNLSPNFISVSGIEENQTFVPGEQATLTLHSGLYLPFGFDEYHFEHLFIYINDLIITPAIPDNYEMVSELKIPFTVPDEDMDIVVCYSIQQQIIENGFTMTLEENPAVKLYGVSPDGHYKYFDCYLVVRDAYVIENIDFKMGNGPWTPVAETTGCSFYADEDVPNVYHIVIRPDYQNVTGDIELRVSGKQEHRYTISWTNAEAKFLDLEKSKLPTGAISGNEVTAELWVNEDYYLAGASASDGTPVETIRRAYVRFTMPSTDVNITLDIKEKVPVTYTESEHVKEALVYNAPDIYYGWEVTNGIPGEKVYVIAKADSGYKPMTATNDNGEVFPFTHYGEDMYVATVEIPEGSSSMTFTVQCKPAWTVTSKQSVAFNEGFLYAEGETVPFAVEVPSGKVIDSVTALTESGDPVALTLDLPYGSFVMPAGNVVLSVTYGEIVAGETVSVKAYYDEDQYHVKSSTNYDWKFNEGFTVNKGTTFYLEVYDDYGMDFYVGVKIGDKVATYHANFDEDWGEYSFGKAFTADADMEIKVGPTEASVSFAGAAVEDKVSVKAYFDEDQYRVKSSTNYDWNFAEGFTIDKGSSFYMTVQDDYGESFFVGVKIGDDVQTYPAVEDEDTGEYTFGKSFTPDADMEIKVGPTEASVSFAGAAVEDKVSVKAYFDEDQYRVKSSTNYDWNFAEGFTIDKGSSFYMTVQDDYGESFFVGVKIGDDVQTYPAVEDEDTGEYTFGKSFTPDANMEIKVGPSSGSVQF